MKTQEEKDFEYFKENQLHYVDFLTGTLDTKHPSKERYSLDVGSLNPDGYIRLWCKGNLRMKHRLLYWLYHNDLPNIGEEIDHYGRNRSNNSISNLRILSKSKNNEGCKKTFKQMSKEVVHQICNLLQSTDLSDQTIADKVGRSRGTIRDIKTRRSRTSISKSYSWNHRGY